MPLQLVLSENRACHSRQGKGTHLKSAAIVAFHIAIISLSHLDGLTRLHISFAIAHASGGRVHLWLNSDHSNHILINNCPWRVPARRRLPCIGSICQCRVTHPWTLNPAAAKYYRPIRLAFVRLVSLSSHFL